MESRMIKGFKDFAANESMTLGRLMLTTEQSNWIDSNIERKAKWVYNSNGKVDINGDFNCSFDDSIRDFKGIQFGHIKGNFSCSFCHNLESLIGAPEIVDGIFSCNNTKIKSLEGAPKYVGVTFRCYSNPGLKNLIGSPETVKGSFNCNVCINLVSLEGAPKSVGADFDCRTCPELVTLAGAPIKRGFIYCDGCPKLPKEEVELSKDKELFSMWLESKLPIKEFLEKKRGTIHGKKYGI
jgi:hypothetical protein